MTATHANGITEHAFQVRRLRRCPDGAVAETRTAVIDRPHKRYPVPPSFQNRLEDVARGRLPIRAGDADQGQVPSRATVIVRRKHGQRRTGRTHLEPRHGCTGRLLRDHCYRAIRNRLGYEVVAVGLFAPDRDEHRTRADGTGVIGDAGNVLCRSVSERLRLDVS